VTKESVSETTANEGRSDNVRENGELAEKKKRTLIVENVLPLRLSSNLLPIHQYPQPSSRLYGLAELLHQFLESRNLQARAHDDHEVGGRREVKDGEGTEGEGGDGGFVVEGYGGAEEGALKGGEGALAAGETD
jgi:hypothetical protein